MLPLQFSSWKRMTCLLFPVIGACMPMKGSFELCLVSHRKGVKTFGNWATGSRKLEPSQSISCGPSCFLESTQPRMFLCPWLAVTGRLFANGFGPQSMPCAWVLRLWYVVRPPLATLLSHASPHPWPAINLFYRSSWRTDSTLEFSAAVVTRPASFRSMERIAKCTRLMLFQSTGAGTLTSSSLLESVTRWVSVFKLVISAGSMDLSCVVAGQTSISSELDWRAGWTPMSWLLRTRVIEVIPSAEPLLIWSLALTRGLQTKLWPGMRQSTRGWSNSKFWKSSFGTLFPSTRIASTPVLLPLKWCSTVERSPTKSHIKALLPASQVWVLSLWLVTVWIHSCRCIYSAFILPESSMNSFFYHRLPVMVESMKWCHWRMSQVGSLYEAQVMETSCKEVRSLKQQPMMAIDVY